MHVRGDLHGYRRRRTSALTLHTVTGNAATACTTRTATGLQFQITDGERHLPTTERRGRQLADRDRSNLLV